MGGIGAEARTWNRNFGQELASERLLVCVGGSSGKFVTAIELERIMREEFWVLNAVGEVVLLTYRAIGEVLRESVTCSAAVSG